MRLDKVRLPRVALPQIVGQAQLYRRPVGKGGLPWLPFWQERNIITNGFLRQMIRAIGGYGAVADYKVAWVRFGTDGTAEAATDTTITGAVSAAISAFSYPTALSVRFEALLAASAGNGVAFQEMGLVAANGVLMARKAFPVMTKSDLWEWLAKWTITMTNPTAADDSQVTDVGVQNLIKILAGDGAENLYVDRMQFGTGTASPLPTDTQLQTPIVPIKDIASRTLVDDYHLALAAYLIATEANGFPISEAGILAVNDSLVARATFPTQEKDEDHHFGFTWTLQPAVVPS